MAWVAVLKLRNNFFWFPTEKKKFSTACLFSNQSRKEINSPFQISK
jgi:hypothetical protein